MTVVHCKFLKHRRHSPAGQSLTYNRTDIYKCRQNQNPTKILKTYLFRVKAMPKKNQILQKKYRFILEFEKKKF